MFPPVLLGVQPPEQDPQVGMEPQLGTEPQVGMEPQRGPRQRYVRSTQYSVGSASGRHAASATLGPAKLRRVTQYESSGNQPELKLCEVNKGVACEPRKAAWFRNEEKNKEVAGEPQKSAWFQNQKDVSRVLRTCKDWSDLPVLSMPA